MHITRALFVIVFLVLLLLCRLQIITFVLCNTIQVESEHIPRPVQQIFHSFELLQPTTNSSNVTSS
jgi:hypothetical protein